MMIHQIEFEGGEGVRCFDYYTYCSYTIDLRVFLYQIIVLVISYDLVSFLYYSVDYKKYNYMRWMSLRSQFSNLFSKHVI